MPTIHWSKPICKEPGHYLGWGTIAKTDAGELLVVFSGRRQSHWCPYGVNELIRSDDGGATWSEPVVINNTPLDDRDTGLLVTNSGALVMSWFTGTQWKALDKYKDRINEDTYESWVRLYEKIGREVIEHWDGAWTRRSTDTGRTWEDAVPSIASAPHGPIELTDGRLLYIGTAHQMVDGHMLAVESVDEGRSWQKIGTVPIPPEYEGMPFSEPHVVEVAKGRIICLWRHNPRDQPNAHFLQQSESTDGGHNWSVTHATPMFGYPPHIIRLASGDILATYGVRRSPYGQRACLSHDGGLTWDIENEIILRDDAPNGDLGYPSTVELGAGELLTTYYQIDRIGEKTSFLATRWSLD